MVFLLPTMAPSSVAGGGIGLYGHTCPGVAVINLNGIKIVMCGGLARSKQAAFARRPA